MEGKNLERLSRLLNDEITIFQELLKIEKLKNAHIVNQDIDDIKKLTENEEMFLDQVAKKEKERETIAEKLFQKYRIKSHRVLSALLEEIPEEENEIKNMIKKQKKELVRNIKDLKKINAINSRLLMDSIKFFNQAAHSLQNVEAITYSNGKNKKNYNQARIIDRQV
ncbi:MAG: flagellar export chaperone FlgN [Spirochaetes bacterium]|nr:flagellar export chaperone FlgN [Spirochaetota bacterium]